MNPDKQSKMNLLLFEVSVLLAVVALAWWVFQASFVDGGKLFSFFWLLFGLLHFIDYQRQWTQDPSSWTLRDLAISEKLTLGTIRIFDLIILIGFGPLLLLICLFLPKRSQSPGSLS